ncbi:Flp family type IVb pilin [uncultured Vibrio sp.]|uniref:Flp family type IVb pilin n=1 Tax=uncultured Vibrio sp. TaxID=114054 RepID=UPI00090FB6E9|nr:Flp family type IVb pilin [uncultured Vibrio sp.]OIQ25789.1 MAG: fimbrial protein [Vibrio sp. MedPE-SWchi]
MSNLINSVKNFMQDEEGLTVVEYVVGAGLLVAGLAGIFGAFSSILEDELSSVFNQPAAAADGG